MANCNRNWCYMIGASVLLSACSPAPDSTNKQAKAEKTPAVISAMAQAKALNANEEELKLAKRIEVKTRKNKLASIEAALPSKTDQYTILFDINTNKLNEAYKGELIAFAAYLNKNKNAKVHVDGYTCELGSAEYNVALGQRRAQAVANFLESKGVSESQIVLVSYGKERPADPSHNELAWMKNRRVEVFF